LLKQLSSFPSWIYTQLGITNRGADHRPMLGDVVTPVVVIEREQTGALAQSQFNDAETIGGGAFMARIVQAAVAAQLSHVQLKNPAGSARVVFIDMFLAGGAAAADTIRWGMKDADMTTDGGACINRDNAGIASIAHVRSMTNAANQLDSEMGELILLANTQQFVELNPPIRLVAGEGFGIRGVNVNTNLFASFFFREYQA
jgi:hypothetical protein